MLTMTTLEFEQDNVMGHTKALVNQLWRANAALTAVGFLMLGALAASAAGLWLDPRTIGGAPAWLKPAKFALSTAAYALTLAWILSYLPAWRRTRRVAGWITAVVFVAEVTIIDIQAWRGTTSHFNAGTPLDAALFAGMGAAILVQTLSSVVVLVALWRETFVDAAFGWALRLGLSISIIGAMTGAVMTSPTSLQLAEARATHHLTVAGAHTVGAPDGGPGLAGTGWSVSHGDLRVPHFLGLHGMQALPLFLFFIHRRVAPRQRVGLVVTAAASYASLFALLLWQALNGQSVVQPDAIAVTMFITWLALSAIASWMAVGGRESRHLQAVIDRGANVS
jgi:hypothetical protein